MKLIEYTGTCISIISCIWYMYFNKNCSIYTTLAFPDIAEASILTSEHKIYGK